VLSPNEDGVSSTSLLIAVVDWVLSLLRSPDVELADATSEAKFGSHATIAEFPARVGFAEFSTVLLPAKPDNAPEPDVWPFPAHVIPSPSPGLQNPEGEPEAYVFAEFTEFEAGEGALTQMPESVAV
jgi:hypothetical protein